jgi:putative ABC transport system permease protein
MKSAWARRLTLGITLCAIALASALLLAVERVRGDARQSFTQSVSGVDLVVGARSGSVQLMLYAVFHSGSATHNMRWDSFEAMASHPAVDWAVPLSLGDGHRGFPVLGTNCYFERFHGDARHFRCRSAFAEVFETVLGSEARRGSAIAPAIQC